MSDRSNLPLAGIVVLDFGQVFQGPYATLLMAKAGADVIKIEPPHGEPLRRRAAPGKSTTFPIAMLNSNKRAITLNLKHERGRALLFEMARRADVLLENFSPGTMDRLGVGWAELSRVNPRLIYASGSGYGLSGPDRDNLAMDLTIQAVSGLISTTGFPDGPPVKAGPAVVDFLSGIHLYAAVTTALFERGRTGKGRLVEVAMQEAAYATLTSHLEAYWQSGTVPPRTGNRSHARSPLGVYPTNDGYVAINVAVEEHWHHLLTAIGREDLSDNPRFKTNADRVAHVDETDALVGAWTATSARWRCSRSPSGTGSIVPLCAMSARSCMTRTCTSAACSNGSSTTRSAISSSRPRHCVFTARTEWRPHPSPSSPSTMPKSTGTGSDCRPTTSPTSDRAASFSGRQAVPLLRRL